uniref:Uncharacterized protein n=1 Tax=Parascaris equorum TaxID=6256 RepID=A0A914RL48_PAREQ
MRHKSILIVSERSGKTPHINFLLEQCPLRTPRRRVYPTIVRTFVPLANSPMPTYFMLFAADMKLNLFIVIMP